jgi:hypothetical protein
MRQYELPEPRLALGAAAAAMAAGTLALLVVLPAALTPPETRSAGALAANPAEALPAISCRS